MKKMTGKESCSRMESSTKSPPKSINQSERTSQSVLKGKAPAISRKRRGLNTKRSAVLRATAAVASPYPRFPFRNPRRRRRRNPRCGAAAAIIAPLDAAAARGRGKAAWHHPLGAALKAQSLSWLPDKRGRAPPAAAERGSSRRRRRAALGVVECGQDLSCQTKIRLIPTLGGVGK